MNADGIIGANKDHIGYNLYAYVSNNFVNKKDVTGKGLFDWIVDLMESVFNYSAKKATKGTNIKIQSPIQNKKNPNSKNKITTDAIVKVVANSKISCNVGINSGYGGIYGEVSYGGTIAPNSGINKNNITVGGGMSISKGLFPISPSASFAFQPGFKNIVDLLNDDYTYFNGNNGWGGNFSNGAGANYNLFGFKNNPYNFSVSPSVGMDLGINYTWEWDKK